MRVEVQPVVTIRRLTIGDFVGDFVCSKGLWFIGLAALVFALAACSSSEPISEPTTLPTSSPTVAASTNNPTPTTAQTTTQKTTGNAATVKAPTAVAAPTPERDDRVVFLGTPDPTLPDDPSQLMKATISGNVAAIARKMVASQNLSYIPVLMEYLRFQTREEATYSVAAFINIILEGPDDLNHSPRENQLGVVD